MRLACFCGVHVRYGGGEGSTEQAVVFSGEKWSVFLDGLDEIAHQIGSGEQIARDAGVLAAAEAERHALVGVRCWSCGRWLIRGEGGSVVSVWERVDDQ